MKDCFWLEIFTIKNIIKEFVSRFVDFNKMYYSITKNIDTNSFLILIMLCREYKCI